MTRKVGDNADPQLTDLFEVNSWFRSYHLRRTTRNDERTRELDDNEELLGLKAIPANSHALGVSLTPAG